MKRKLIGAASIIATTLGLAAVIVGVSALSTPQRPTPDQPAQQRSRLVDLQDRADNALRSGDTTLASQLIGQALLLDPENAETKRLTVAVERAQDEQEDSTRSNPDTDTGDPDAQPGDPDSAYLSARKDLTPLLPQALTGFKTLERKGGGSEAVLVASSVSQAGVERVTLTVFDRKTTKAAQAFVDGLKKTYPDNAANVTIGSRKGRYGADERLGAAAFARGRFAFEVVVVSSGTSGTKLRDIAVKLAAAFPTAK